MSGLISSLGLINSALRLIYRWWLIKSTLRLICAGLELIRLINTGGSTSLRLSQCTLALTCTFLYSEVLDVWLVFLNS